MRCLAILSFYLVWTCYAVADGTVGVRTLMIEGERPLSLTLWYPAEGGTAQTVGGNAVFEGVQGVFDAPLPDALLPVVLVSHGGLRSATDSGAWLSSALARTGYLAIEVNAPRPANATQAINEVWQRPRDIVRALDAISAAPIWRDVADMTAVSAVGFALGGTAVLSIAGGTLSLEQVMTSCTGPTKGPDCAWFAAQGVGLDSMDVDALAGLRGDQRIKTVIALSPEYLSAFGHPVPSMSAVAHVLTFGQKDGPFAALTPFDAFGVCTPKGPAILAEDGGPPALCGASAQGRSAAHDVVLQRIHPLLSDK